jgi:hypothetical protein
MGAIRTVRRCAGLLVICAATLGSWPTSARAAGTTTTTKAKSKKKARAQTAAPEEPQTEAVPAQAAPPPEPPKETALDKPKPPADAPKDAKAKLAPEDEPASAPPAPPPPPPSTTPSAPEPDASPLVAGAPVSEDEASIEGGKLFVHPYLLLAGGLKFDNVIERPGEVKNDRISTFALGRLGVKARWLDFVSAESEFMASGGVSLHGTSAYEGQAAMQVRQQVIRLTKYGFMVEVGRIIDEASVDFFSAHVADTFIQDTATRDPLLFDGFNLGNGVRATYAVIPGLRVGLTFNAGNPVATTSTRSPTSRSASRRTTFPTTRSTR